jgi:FkbM family methyltransferase
MIDRNMAYIQVVIFLRLVYFYKISGLQTFFKCLGSTGLATIKFSGSQNALYLRRGTSDIAVFNSIYAFSEFSGNFHITKGDTIIDCGANIGISTLYFAEKYPDNKVIAIEPDRENFLLLQKNTKHCPNVSCLEGAIHNSSGNLFLQNPNSENWGFIFSEKEPQLNRTNEQSVMVTAFSLDEIIEKHKIDTVGLLKIDIEGGEKDLFAKNLQWLSRVKTMVVELHDDIIPHCSSTLYRALNEIDFKQSIKGEKVILTL